MHGLQSRDYISSVPPPSFLDIVVSAFSFFPLSPLLIRLLQRRAALPATLTATPVRLGPLHVARPTHSIQLFPSWLPAFLIRFFLSFRVPHSEFRNYENLSSVHGSAVL